jgi:hypothetical protein
MFTLTLLTISSISLLFTTTRLFGVVCLTLISYQYPLLLIALIALTGIYFYLKHSK